MSTVRNKGSTKVMYLWSKNGRFVTKKRAERVKGVKMSQAHKRLGNTVLSDHDYAISSDRPPATRSNGDNTDDFTLFTDRDVPSDNNHVTDNNINVNTNRPELGTSTVILDPDFDPPTATVFFEVSSSWMEGKRIVDLGRLAEALEHCLFCSMPLRLKSTIGETKYGLGSLLHIRCNNVDCMKVNNICLSGRHTKNRIWDLNTKAALGMY